MTDKETQDYIDELNAEHSNMLEVVAIMSIFMLVLMLCMTLGWLSYELLCTSI